MQQLKKKKNLFGIFSSNFSYTILTNVAFGHNIQSIRTQFKAVIKCDSFSSNQLLDSDFNKISPRKKMKAEMQLEWCKEVFLVFAANCLQKGFMLNSRNILRGGSFVKKCLYATPGANLEKLQTVKFTRIQISQLGVWFQPEGFDLKTDS